MVQMRSTPKTKMSFLDRSDRVGFMEKTRLENDVTGRISLVYAEIETESQLLEPI